MLNYPQNIVDTLSICALRFDGYKYVEEKNLEWRKLIEPVVDNLTLYENINKNFAAFFGLQRYLHKWGGEYLTKYADEHIAYDFLFLHLYRCNIPIEYINEKYCRQWEQEFLPGLEEAAAIIRQSFRRKGRGKKIAL